VASRIWIVHRDARWRDALRRLVGGAPAWVADPTDPSSLRHAPFPRVIVLGVGGDFEAELEWAHRAAAHLARAAATRGEVAGGVAGPRWVLVAGPRDLDEARRLFDALPVTVVPLDADAGALRRRLADALLRRPAAALSERRRRDALGDRFERWLGDLELPELLAAIDPARHDLPLLVRGEPGTGRGLVARLVHLQRGTGGAAPGPFGSVVAWPGASAGSLLTGLVPEIGSLGGAGLVSLCVEEVDRLSRATQRQLSGWIENGVPPGVAGGAPCVRWMATAGDPVGEDRLDPGLARSLAGVVLRIPPLRERPEGVTRLAEATVRAWTVAVPGAAPARLGDDALAALRAHPWPGNARELEAVVRRSVARAARGVLGAGDLAFEELALPRDPEEDETLEPWPPETGPPLPAERPGPGEEPAIPAPLPAPRGPSAAADEPPRPAGPRADEPLRRLAGAVAHEVGNPLVGIRTFAQMLPSRFDDPEFRAQFSSRVEADTRRIEAVIETLTRLGTLPAPERSPVDLSAVLARLLQLQRGRIQERRLVVLEELDRAHPLVLGDAEQLRFAFGLLFDEALSWIPEGGDLYVATRRQPGSPAAPPRLRILLRSHAGSGTAIEPGLHLAENTLAVAAVEAVVRAHGGTLAVEPGEAGETLVLIELPAPEEAERPPGGSAEPM
jgi:DNA-binding NtrC family response regulator